MSPRSHINPDRLPPPGLLSPIRPRCPVCGKTTFSTEREARREATRIQAEDGTRLDTYFCLDANGWHFTNADQPVAKRSERWVRAMLRPPKKRK